MMSHTTPDNTALGPVRRYLKLDEKVERSLLGCQGTATVTAPGVQSGHALPKALPWRLSFRRAADRNTTVTEY